MSSDGKISAEEMLKHNSVEDCWIVVNGKVYDLTNFAPNHPGGAQMVYDWAGKDGTKTYNMYHSESLIDKTLMDSDKKGTFDSDSITDEWKKAQENENAETAPADPNEAPPLSTLINLDDFERAFEKVGAAKSWAYIIGASNDCLSYNANKNYWYKLWFRPRIMRNVKDVNTRMKMMGADVAMPLWISPMGIAKSAGDEGELALGRGAAKGGIMYCQSTAASYSIEEILEAAPKTYPHFFQLYVDRNRHKTEETLARIETMPQIKAIFVTVDLPVVSKREQDERVLEASKVKMSSYHGGGDHNQPDKRGGGLARSTGNFIDWTLSWDDLPWIRKHTSKPIFLKGIQSAADAKMALQMGCAGIVVSNHGGRALDNAPGTLLVLLELKRDCPEVFEKMEVHIDGGIRRGSDILKAVLLGAKGVGIGRPFQCSVLYGTEGVEQVIEILQDELETAMRLCGITNLEQARGDVSYLNSTELEQLLPPRPNPGQLLFNALRQKAKL